VSVSDLVVMMFMGNWKGFCNQITVNPYQRRFIHSTFSQIVHDGINYSAEAMKIILTVHVAYGVATRYQKLMTY
jgi:hypothetical protein